MSETGVASSQRVWEEVAVRVGSSVAFVERCSRDVVGRGMEWVVEGTMRWRFGGSWGICWRWDAGENALF